VNFLTWLADAYVMKSIDMKELKSSIRQCLKRCAQDKNPDGALLKPCCRNKGQALELGTPVSYSVSS